MVFSSLIVLWMMLARWGESNEYETRGAEFACYMHVCVKCCYSIVSAVMLSGLGLLCLAASAYFALRQ